MIRPPRQICLPRCHNGTPLHSPCMLPRSAPSLRFNMTSRSRFFLMRRLNSWLCCCLLRPSHPLPSPRCRAPLQSEFRAGRAPVSFRGPARPTRAAPGEFGARLWVSSGPGCGRVRIRGWGRRSCPCTRQPESLMVHHRQAEKEEQEARRRRHGLHSASSGDIARCRRTDLPWLCILCGF